ncbi:MAG: MBL fold metallo-hydrolase [Oscillospiraceae bacterium]
MRQVYRFGGRCNCYLIKGKNGSVLIDTGPRALRERLYQAVKDENLCLILLTHGHADHIANAAWLAEQCRVPIAMHIADYGLITSCFSGKVETTGLVGKFACRLLQKARQDLRLEGFEPDFYLRQGARLDQYGFAATVYELPGHTPGSIGFLTDSGRFFVGDAVMSLPLPGPARTYQNKAQLLASVQRIKNSPARVVYGGHGPPMPRILLNG